MFDSGGFFVQKGDITYNELYSKLREIYRTEDWADIYILPDNPPLSKDSMLETEDKIRQTVEGSVSFAYQLPVELREKVMPVIHAKQPAHLEYCLQNYAPLTGDSNRIGFGSFSTRGSTKLSTYNYHPQWKILKEYSGNYYQMLKDMQIPT